MSKLQEKIEKYEQELSQIDREWEARDEMLKANYSAEKGGYLGRKQALVDMIKDLKELLPPDESNEIEEKVEETSEKNDVDGE